LILFHLFHDIIEHRSSIWSISKRPRNESLSFIWSTFQNAQTLWIFKSIVTNLSCRFDQSFKMIEPCVFLNLSWWILVVDLQIKRDLGRRFTKLFVTLQQPLKLEIRSFQVKFGSATCILASLNYIKQLWFILTLILTMNLGKVLFVRCQFENRLMCPNKIYFEVSPNMHNFMHPLVYIIFLALEMLLLGGFISLASIKLLHYFSLDWYVIVRVMFLDYRSYNAI